MLIGREIGSSMEEERWGLWIERERELMGMIRDMKRRGIQGEKEKERH